MVGGRRWVYSRNSRGRGDRWDSTPDKWPSGAVQAVPVLFEAAAETGDDALHDSAPVGDHCGPGCLSLEAGGKTLEIVVARTDGGVKTGGFRGDVVQPAPAGIGVALGPDGGLSGPARAEERLVGFGRHRPGQFEPRSPHTDPGHRQREERAHTHRRAPPSHVGKGLASHLSRSVRPDGPSALLSLVIGNLRREGEFAEDPA